MDKSRVENDDDDDDQLKEIKIKNEGMPKRGSYSHKSKKHSYGDLIVQFVIAFPEKLGQNDKQVIRDVLKKL